MFAKINLYQFSLPIVLGSLVLGLSFVSPYFLTAENISNALVASATVGILAVGATIVIGAGGIDLSSGAVMALAACLGVSFGLYLNSSGILMIVFCLTAGLIIGVINGTISAKTAIPPFIITLATMSIMRGLSFIIMDGKPLYDLPHEIVFLGQGSFIGIPMPIIIFFCDKPLWASLINTNNFWTSLDCTWR
jgi:ribose/xylose/arabinose/galactoside ABC-type transport system permease subunit